MKQNPPQKSDVIVRNRTPGVFLFILAALLLGTSALLWHFGVNPWLASALAGFALFLLASGIQGFIGVEDPFESEKHPMRITKRKLPMVVGLIPLLYAIIVVLIFSPPKIRVAIIFFVLFAGIIISYLKDAFDRTPSATKEKLDKFYGKAAEAHEALGIIDRGPTRDSVATRDVSAAKKRRLLQELFAFAPWQLIAAFVLAIALMVTMQFVD